MLDGNLRSAVNSLLGSDPIVAITQIQNDAAVSDSTTKYILHTRRAELILIVSNEISPLLVKRAVDRQKQFRAALPPELAEPIEAPILQGLTGNRSYAVWIRRRPITSIRGWAKLEKALIAPRIYRWLNDLAEHTVFEVNSSKLIENLSRLQSVSGMSECICVAARSARESFRSGEIPSVLAAQHGDFWIGNILKAPTRAGFTIVDWAGARLDGAPFFDIVRFALSVGASTSKLRRVILEHSRVVGCAPSHALAYTLCGLGALHFELEHFPESRFLALSEQKFNALHTLFRPA